MYDDNNNLPPVIHHENQVTTGVVVPGLQSLITGVLVGAAAGAVSAWFNLPAWAIAGTAAATISATAWLSYRGRWAWLLEQASGVDLNGDHFIGEPQQPAPQPVRVIVEQDNGHQVDYIDLPPTIDREKAALFARGLLGGRVFAQTAWTGATGLFSRGEYDQLVSVFISRGLAQWRNPGAHAQGLTLTAPGRAVLRHLATPTLPGGQDDRK